MDVHYTSKTDLYATPDWLFERLDNVFHFTLDPCATPGNAKCKKFFTKDDDGLLQDWAGERVFMNPPYGRGISNWVRKAYETAETGAVVVCLLPARTCTRWFHDYCAKGEIEFLKGRLKFGNLKDNAPFPSMVVVFRQESMRVG